MAVCVGWVCDPIWQCVLDGYVSDMAVCVGWVCVRYGSVCWMGMCPIWQCVLDGYVSYVAVCVGWVCVLCGSVCWMGICPMWQCVLDGYVSYRDLISLLDKAKSVKDMITLVTGPPLGLHTISSFTTSLLATESHTDTIKTCLSTCTMYRAPRTIRQSVLDGYVILIILNVRLLRTSGNAHCLLFCTAPRGSMSVYGCLCGGNNVIIFTYSKTFVKSH